MILQNIAQLFANHTEDRIIQIWGMRLLKAAHSSAEAHIPLTNLLMVPHSKNCTVVILRFSSDPHLKHL